MTLTYCETITAVSYKEALAEVMRHVAIALEVTGVPDIDVYVAPSAPGAAVHEYEFTLTYRTEE